MSLAVLDAVRHVAAMVRAVELRAVPAIGRHQNGADAIAGRAAAQRLRDRREVTGRGAGAVAIPPAFIGVGRRAGRIEHVVPEDIAQATG